MGRVLRLRWWHKGWILRTKSGFSPEQVWILPPEGGESQKHLCFTHVFHCRSPKAWLWLTRTFWS